MPTVQQWIDRQWGHNSWLLLSDLLQESSDEGQDIIPEEALRITCDTRTFSLYCGFGPAEIDEDRGIVALMNSPHLIKPDFCISRDKIIPWLLNLRNWSGGEAAWRHLSFDCPEVVLSNSWGLKYIRFYAHPKLPDTYIVCDANSKAFKWRLLTEDNLCKDDLHVVTKEMVDAAVVDINKKE